VWLILLVNAILAPLIFQSENLKPILFKNLNFQSLKEFNFAYFKKNFGDIKIYVTRCNSNSIDMDGNIKKMTMGEYCDLLKEPSNLYFKTEDEYDFLNIIGIKNKIMREFVQFDKNNSKKDCSFWMGGKGTTTGWHTDIDDLSYLYVIEGKKKIQFISPKYNKNMYERHVFTCGAKWSNIDFKNIDYVKYPKFKDVEIQTYILNAGDCIYIPKNWWHCVENLEPTIGVTYKIFRTKQCIFSGISEYYRKLYAIYHNYKIYDMGKIIRENLTEEELLQMQEQICKNKKTK
jgi:hypothetical protein